MKDIVKILIIDSLISFLIFLHLIINPIQLLFQVTLLSLVRVVHLITSVILVDRHQLPRFEGVLPWFENLLDLRKLPINLFLSVGDHSLLRPQIFQLLQIQDVNGIDGPTKEDEAGDVHENDFLQLTGVPNINRFTIYPDLKPVIHKLRKSLAVAR